MDFFTWLMELVDAFLIAPYRWPQDPVLGWWLGTFILALWSTILGEITLAIAFRANRSHVKETTREMTEYHDRSMNALKAGDKGAYRAINKLANEAFGKTFFLQIAMASASLWPVACALGWMQTRFSNIRFPLPFDMPLLGETAGYPFIFIPLYILTRIIFGKVKKLLRTS
ncbi:MAG: hypothetical protein JRJ21_01740 [Deltaproteobacteria bacterium]|nr:hypothetical protein [Deltaproteobacteria bacterium]